MDTKDNEGLGVPASEQAVALSATSPQPKTASGLSAAIANAAVCEPSDESLWDWMEQRGYRNYGNRLEHKYAERVYYKSFERNGENDRGYQIEASVYSAWDDNGCNRKPPYKLSFRMLVNHETLVDVNRMDIMVIRDGMTLLQFEERCAKLWMALLTMFPRTTDAKATTPNT